MTDTDGALVARRESAVAIPVQQVLNAIIGAAANPDVDVGKMQALLGLQKELMAMQAEQEFNAAYQRLQVKLPRITKRGQVEYKDKRTNEMQKAFKFATYEAIDDALRPLEQEEGFYRSFDTAPRQGDGGGVVVTCTLHHSSGHKRISSIPVPLDTSGGKNNIQGYGSALSYGKRYTTNAIHNIITENEDDDGKRGGQRFITEAQVEELQALAKQAGREETPFVERLFAGEIHTFDEIEVGTAFNAAKSTLMGIVRQQQAKGAA